MNYGSHVRDLLVELKRTSDGDELLLPPYNDVSVQSAIQDFQLHVEALNLQVQAATSDGSGGGNGKASINVRPSIVLQRVACERNKRGLLSYHWNRIQRIQTLYYWQSKDNALIQEDAETIGKRYKNINPAEAEFLSTYQNIIAKYTSNAIPEITDLRTYAIKPPLAIDRVQVRVVDDTPFQGSPVVLESGQSVNFIIGSTHYLFYSDCEEYIRTGVLKLLVTEENEG